MLLPEKLGSQLPLFGNEGKLVLQVSLRSRRKGRLKEESNVPENFASESAASRTCRQNADSRIKM